MNANNLVQTTIFTGINMLTHIAIFSIYLICYSVPKVRAVIVVKVLNSSSILHNTTTFLAINGVIYKGIA